MHQARFCAGNLCGDHAGDYVPGTSGPVRARLYLPAGVAHPAGHGGRARNPPLGN